MQRSVVHTHNHWTDLLQATRYFESILVGVKSSQNPRERLGQFLFFVKAAGSAPVESRKGA